MTVASDSSSQEHPGRDAVTIAVLCRADEHALARTLRSLEHAAVALSADGREVDFAICVNGTAGTGGTALRAAQPKGARPRPG